MTGTTLKAVLDELHRRYNRAAFIHTDPVVHLHQFGHMEDREVAGIITAGLAYGRVGQINRSVSAVLEALGDSPARTVRTASTKQLRKSFGDFRHRFTTGREVADLLGAVGEILRRHGSLNAAFLDGMSDEDVTVMPGQVAFVKVLRETGGFSRNSLLSCPSDGSACKRLNLYLRWMVRQDEVDPGGWQGISPSMLLVPLDVHMHRTALSLGLTTRRQADGKAVLEVTDRFRMIDPEDPLRYDFALTRPGITGMPGISWSGGGDRPAPGLS